MTDIPEPFSMTRITGKLIGGLAFVGAFNDIPQIHYLWLSVLFVISQAVFIWLHNERSPLLSASDWRSILWSGRQVFFVMLGVAVIAYPVTADLFRISYNITFVDIGAAALIAAMGFAQQRAESENRKWKILLFRALQKHELSADDLKFLRVIIAEE